jgi:PleD family two-component response regulator
MSKYRLLIVEDDNDISDMLNIYFSSEGYDIDTALRGSDALLKTRQNLPHLIVLDIILPDIDGFEVCRRLRTNPRTSHVPIIFLTQKDERSDKLQGLELGADDYITKPFDIEELKLRIQRSIARSEQQSLTDPHSGLPSGKLIEEQLRKFIMKKGWTFLDINIQHFEPFNELYGFIAGDDVLRFTAMLMGEIIDEWGTEDDFIGHPGGSRFIIITSTETAPTIQENLKSRFDNEVLSHYNFMDRSQGYILTTNQNGIQEQVPFMNLRIGEVSQEQYEFSDIRQITELAAEARRRNN